MSDSQSTQPQASSAADTCRGEEPPDLSSTSTLAERGEFADAADRLADAYGRRLPENDPLRPLATQLARSLTEAGFTLHHCVRYHPLYRLGGVCLLPISRDHDHGDGVGVVVSWTTHDLLSKDWERWPEYRGALEAMTEALGHVLVALGYQVRPFGSGGASLVTGRRSGRQEAGR